MGKYILFVSFIAGNNGAPAITSAEFNSKQSCLFAAEIMNSELNSQTLSRRVKTKCFPK